MYSPPPPPSFYVSDHHHLIHYHLILYEVHASNVLDLDNEALVGSNGDSRSHTISARAAVGGCDLIRAVRPGVFRVAVAITVATLHFSADRHGQKCTQWIARTPLVRVSPMLDNAGTMRDRGGA